MKEPKVEKIKKTTTPVIKTDKQIEDKKNFDALYEYVKREIMGYTDEKLDNDMVLKLRGLQTGLNYDSKYLVPLATYDLKTILYTFKICKPLILDGFKNNHTKFNSEMHKFNYAIVIIQKNINDVVIRLKNAKKAEEKTIELPLENQTHEGVAYKVKTENKTIREELEELW